MKIEFLRLWAVNRVKDDGSVEGWFIGVDPDGGRWIDADLLGIGPEELLAMARDTPGCVSAYPGTGRVLVKVRAAIDRCRPPRKAEENLIELVREYWDGSKPVIFWN
jgi:hypothetical protein